MTLARRLNRINLLRVTSGKEILRLTLGSEARLVIKSALQAENRLSAAWAATAAWVRSKRKAKEPAPAEATPEGSAAVPALAEPERKPE